MGVDEGDGMSDRIDDNGIGWLSTRNVCTALVGAILGALAVWLLAP